MISDVHISHAQWLMASGQKSGESLQERITELFTVLRAPLFRYVVVLLRDASEAEDVTQECFFRLFIELRTGGSVNDVKAWLFRVGHNLAVDRHRQHHDDTLDGAARQIADGGPSSEEEMLHQERLEMVRAAVERLSPQQRQCLHLRTEGFRYREIAEILNVSESTVYENLRRGLTRLIKDFKP